MRTILGDTMQTHAYLCAFLLRGNKLNQKLRIRYGLGFWGAFVLKGSYDRFKERIYNFRGFLKNQRKRITRALLDKGHASP
jgi:hypothetical protein